jgi:hypothetical protein
MQNWLAGMEYALTRCSSLANMPLPMMATPIVMSADAEGIVDGSDL